MSSTLAAPAASVSPTRWDRFPFAPKRFPFFYGWVVLPLAILGLLVSVPGQTIGVSVFTDPLLRVLDLSRVQLSTAYMAGTVFSAFMLPRAGRLYDRVGARVLTPLSALGLGATLVMLSVIDRLIDFLQQGAGFSRQATAMAAMIVSFGLLRFFGQGMMTMVPRNMVMKWFVRRRGLINGVLGVSIAVGFSLLTYALNLLVQHIGWAAAWRYLGLGIGTGIAIVTALFYRDSPEGSGLLPDGGSPADAAGFGTAELLEGATLKQARGYFEFWMYCLGPALVALTVTAVSFHIVSIYEEAGHTRAEAVGVYIPAAVISSIGVLAGGWALDRLRLCSVLRVMCAAQALLQIGLLTLETSIGYLLVILALGTSQASFGLLLGITWPRLFGVLHLGEIGGFAMSATVLGSAVGPLLFGLSFQWTGSYRLLELCCLLVSLVFLAGAAKLRV